MKFSFRPFQRLQWKMMFPYVLVIPLGMLLIEIVCLIAAIIVIELFFMPSLVLYGDQQAATQASPFFVHNGVPDQQALAAWIHMPVAFETYQPQYYAVVDKQGRVITEIGSNSLPSNAPLQASVPAATAARLQQVLAGKGSAQGIAYQTSDGSVIAIIPILDNNHRVVGALFDDSGPGLASRETAFWISFYAPTFLVSTIFFAIFAFIVAMIGSLYTARNFTRRFRKLALAVDPWSKGDFSVFIQDTSQDEIGQLARQLNRMAEQLQNLLQTRQSLATLEERNRLARDLHDSVKQRIFVAILQVGAAKIQLGQREATTQQRLTEAEGILQQVQQELAALIHELRPVALEEKGLNSALQTLAAQWSRQTDIAASLQIEGESQQALPSLAEEALFRVTQEALSNVMRHSQATSVQIQLAYAPDKVTLSIADNGQGFDTTLAPGQGVGLLSMRERVTAIGGEIHVESASGKGSSVIVQYERQRIIV